MSIFTVLMENNQVKISAPRDTLLKTITLNSSRTLLWMPQKSQIKSYKYQNNPYINY